MALNYHRAKQLYTEEKFEFSEKTLKKATHSASHAKSILILCYARRKAYNSEIRMADLKYFRQKMKSFK